MRVIVLILRLARGRRQQWHARPPSSSTGRCMRSRR